MPQEIEDHSVIYDLNNASVLVIASVTRSFRNKVYAKAGGIEVDDNMQLRVCGKSQRLDFSQHGSLRM